MMTLIFEFRLKFLTTNAFNFHVFYSGAWNTSVFLLCKALCDLVLWKIQKFKEKCLFTCFYILMMPYMLPKWIWMMTWDIYHCRMKFGFQGQWSKVKVMAKNDKKMLFLHKFWLETHFFQSYMVKYYAQWYIEVHLDMPF